MGDHAPFDDATDAYYARARMAAELALMNVTAPLGGPPVGALPPRVKFGGYMICSRCKLASEWCACGKQRAPDVSAKDGGESDLSRRIKDCQGR